MTIGAAPLKPDYRGACVANLVPALLGPGGTSNLPDWFPSPVRDARQVVLLLLDGLGWEQLASFARYAPTIAGLVGSSITTVAPSTTSTALTSIVTGTPPGEHGVVGYRIEVQGEILNVLRWTTPAGDARRKIVPARFQRVPPFLGASVPVVTKSELTTSGFSGAHLASVRHHGYRVTSGLAVNVTELLAAGERFIYAYYDGIDKVAHEYGFDAHYAAELTYADRLVADVIAGLPDDAVLLVTADHGQVDVSERVVALGPDVLGLVRSQSGEGRFRWLHAIPGAAADLLAVGEAAFEKMAWVRSAEQICDEGWLGPAVSAAARGRLGDVALVPSDPVSFDDPADSGPFRLICRHGSLTSAEMLVPLLAAHAG